MQACRPVGVAGFAHEIGRRLGELARPGMAACTAQSAAQSAAWRAIAARRGGPLLAAPWRAAEAAFPECVAAIDGMAAGLSRRRARFGHPVVIDRVGLLGYDALVAMTLNVFETRANGRQTLPCAA